MASWSLRRVSTKGGAESSSGSRDRIRFPVVATTDFASILRKTDISAFQFYAVGTAAEEVEFRMNAVSELSDARWIET